MCGVALHYCRLAPLSTVAEDYKRGRSKADYDANAKGLIKKTTKLQETFNYVTQQYEKQLHDLKALIKNAESQNAPRRYVQNRTTGQAHRALTYYADVGPEALTY